jgi:hypothetical protein
LDLILAYRLGSLVEYLGNSKFILPIVKTRKSTLNLTVLDTFREIESLLTQLEIEALIEPKLYYWINKLEKNYRSDQTLTKADSEELSSDAITIDELLNNELPFHSTLDIVYDGCLKIQDLLDTSEGKRSKIFSRKVWKMLPEIAKSDFSQGATCLLVGAYTPASMVCLRGMEEVIRDYYRIKIGDPKRKKLFIVIDELKKLPNANQKLLGYLDYIRTEKRNFAQHPNKIFTQKEAESIFTLIVNAVHDLYSKLE